MADQFKTFDKAPVVGVVNIKHWSFAVREVILAIVTLSLLVMCLIFVGLYANSKSDNVLTASSSAAFVQKSLCVSKECMETAARSVALMNTSVDPCDNFYQFACGGYKVYNPVSRQYDRTILNDLSQKNVDRLEALIEKPPSRYAEWAYERKLSDFFQTCQDSYQRETLLGRPFLEKVVKPLGGWDLLGTWDESKWDFNEALKKVQSDFWVDAVYSPRVDGDATDSTKRTISLRPAGKGKWMYWSWYLSPYTDYIRNDYKKFIRRVATLLFRDAGLGNVTDEVRDARIDQFVNDTFSMEAKIAAVAENARYRNDPYLEENKVTLSALNRETNNVIDWTSQLSYLFNEANVYGGTKVVLLRKEYFRNVTNMIASIPGTDRKRMLHHYLIWRVAEAYVQDLSWEYIHANREVYVDINGGPNFSGMRRYCMGVVRYYMKDALSALYVQSHMAEESKQKVTDITVNLKKALQTQLEKTPWMDQKTKDYAKRKLDALTFKLGYPDWMANVDHIDNMYSSLTVNLDDFFGNLLSANMFRRSLWNKVLRTGEDRDLWYYGAFDTRMNIFFDWNEIISTAGILQDPIFNHLAPHFSTFGSLGVRLARLLHHVVDEWGARYDIQGSLIEDSWWSNKSITDYLPMHQCVAGVYTNVTYNVTITPDTPPMSLPIDYIRYTPHAITETTGIKLALLGYNDWVADLGVNEKMLPGLSMTPDQMVFLSYAQSQCYNRDDFQTLTHAFRGRVPEDIQINMAMGQLKEFSDAFQCPKGSKMNHAKKCDYY